MIYLPASQTYWEIKYFLRMDRKCFSIFTAIFNSIVAEETYITGQKNAKVIPEIRNYFYHSPEQIFQKNCREGLQGNGQTEVVKVLVRMREHHSYIWQKKIDA